MTDKLTRILDPLKELREYQERQRKIMALAIPDPLKEMREYQERQRKIIALAIPDPLKEMREYQERQRKIIALAIPDPLKELREYQERQRKVLLRKYPNPAEELQKYQKQFVDLYRQSLSVSIDDVEKMDNGSVSILGEVVDPEKIANELIEMSDSSSEPHEFFEKLYLWLNKAGAAVKWVTLNILFPYFISVVAAMHTPYWIGAFNDYHDLPKKSVKSEIVKEGRESFTHEQLAAYRVVTASSLRVREEPGTKSAQIDSLAFGTVVKLLEKSKDWSLVDYMISETQETKTGWVFSRYLNKFN